MGERHLHLIRGGRKERRELLGHEMFEGVPGPVLSQWDDQMLEGMIRGYEYLLSLGRTGVCQQREECQPDPSQVSKVQDRISAIVDRMLEIPLGQWTQEPLGDCVDAPLKDPRDAPGDAPRDTVYDITDRIPHHGPDDYI